MVFCARTFGFFKNLFWIVFILFSCGQEQYANRERELRDKTTIKVEDPNSDDPNITVDSNADSSDSNGEAHWLSDERALARIYILENPKPVQEVLVMFHQGGFNLHEYDGVIPKMLDLNFAVIRADLSNGGVHYGFKNNTVEERGAAVPLMDYKTLRTEIDIVLNYAAKKYANVMPVGSLFTSAVIMTLARDNKINNLKGIALFNIREWIDGESMADAGKNIRIPMLISRPVIDKTEDLDDPSTRWSTKYARRYAYQEGSDGAELLFNPYVEDFFIRYVRSVFKVDGFCEKAQFAFCD